MHNNNSAGEKLLSKPVTNIQMTDDGLLSFDFMGGTTGIKNVNVNDNLNFNDNDNVNDNESQSSKLKAQSSKLYDLSGHRVSAPVKNGLYIVREKDGTVRKQIWQHGR